MTTDLTAALAEVCGYHDPEGCLHCADTLARVRSKGWTDAEILADIELYRTDWAAWEAKVRESALANAQSRLASGETP